MKINHLQYGRYTIIPWMVGVSQNIPPQVTWCQLRSGWKAYASRNLGSSWVVHSCGIPWVFDCIGILGDFSTHKIPKKNIGICHKGRLGSGLRVSSNYLHQKFRALRIPQGRKGEGPKLFVFPEVFLSSN